MLDPFLCFTYAEEMNSLEGFFAIRIFFKLKIGSTLLKLYLWSAKHGIPAVIFGCQPKTCNVFEA